MRISVLTLGCKVNQFESQALADSLTDKGHRIVSSAEDADAVVVNSCTVTHRSDRDARSLVRRIRRANPSAHIVVAGCYAQMDPGALRSLGVDLVVGTAARDALPELVASGATGIHVPEFRWEPPLTPAPVRRFARRARAYLKVQDGCEAYCAYCVVPYARGPSRSLPLEDVCAGFRSLRDGGHQEIVLTGVHLGMWGRDLDPPRPFLELLGAAERSGIPRIRLSSLEPREVSDDVLVTMAGSRCLCPHLHVPLQSGCDRVLQSMRRPYTADQFRATVERAAAVLPGLCLGVDVIVGFPGEDDAAFGDTYRLLENLPLSYLHVFPFSARRGTSAWDMPGAVPAPVIRDRAAALRALSSAKRRHFWQRSLGTVARALPEGTARRGILRMTTRNYIPVRVPWSGPAPEGELTVAMIGIGGDGVRARLVETNGNGKVSVSDPVPGRRSHHGHEPPRSPS